MALDSSKELPMAEMWEYKIVYVPSDGWTNFGLPVDLNERFDEFGKQGWELVGTEAIMRPTWTWFYLWSGSTTVGIVGFFKRRLPG